MEPLAPSRVGILFRYLLLMLAILVPFLVLIGWQLNIQVLKTVLPQFTPMNPVTATCLLGCALALLYEVLRPLRARIAIRALGLFAITVGGLMLLWYITGIDLKVDRLLFTQQLGINRMALGTSIAFFLLGISFLIKPYLVGLLRLCYASIFALGLYSFAAYLYGFVGVYGQTLFNPMAIHTAFTFMIIAIYLFTQEYEEGRFTFTFRYTTALAFGIMTVGVLTSSYVFTWYQAKTVQSVLGEANTLRTEISIDALHSLNGTSADLDAPAYQSIKATLRDVPREYPQYRFAYVLGKNAADQIFFYADSEDPSSPDYSAPGQVYGEASDALSAAWSKPKAFTEGPLTDRWGTWVSGFVPIVNAQNTVVGVVGVDSDASDYYVSLFLYTATPLVGALIGTLIVVIASRNCRRLA